MEVLYSLGTVVTVKFAAGEYTIIGYCPTDEKGEVYTYLGINAAIGLSVDEHVLPFHSKDIDKVVFTGYSDETGESFRVKLGLAMQNQKKD